MSTRRERAIAASPLGPQAAQRYRALRTVSTILRIFALVVAVLGAIGVVVGAGFALQENAGQAGVILVAGLLYAAFISLFLFAYAELLRLLIDLEENTRMTADRLAASGPAT